MPASKDSQRRRKCPMFWAVSDHMVKLRSKTSFRLGWGPLQRAQYSTGAPNTDLG
jgi:hypothetical protein